MHFFQLKYLNVRGILAQKFYNSHTIFLQFSDVKNGGRSQQPSILCQLVTDKSQGIGISCSKESYSYLLMNKFI